MCTLEKLNDSATQTNFDKKVVSATQHLQAYVKHRLYIAESTGVIPKNMYTSSDLIDEAIIKFYENGYDIDMDAMHIKLKLFRIVDTDLNTLYKKEAFHKNTLSTDTILKEELQDLEEQFTIDSDMDYIMLEDLNDISYKQPNTSPHIFLYDDEDTSVLNAFEIPTETSIRAKRLLGNFYSKLPFSITDIVDLFVFGRLSTEDIPKIKDIDTSRIQRILIASERSFKS